MAAKDKSKETELEQDSDSSVDELDIEELKITERIQKTFQQYCPNAPKISTNDLRKRCLYPHPKGFRVDYFKLEADLLKELEADKLYWKQNAAKLRAVAQPGTYEEFRQIVLGAHLEPLKKGETETLRENSAKGRVVWNTVVGSGQESENFREVGLDSQGDTGNVETQTKD